MNKSIFFKFCLYIAFGLLFNHTSIKALKKQDVLIVPVQAVSIATGHTFNCALTSVSGVRCWGDNTYRQLAWPNELSTSTPIDPYGLGFGIKKVAVGTGAHACAINTSDRLLCWGANNVGQTANPISTAIIFAPTEVTQFNGDIRDVVIGSQHTCALIANIVKCWGLNSRGQLGNNSMTDSSIPVTVQGLNEPIKLLSAGSFYSCAVTEKLRVKCWGGNQAGQLANGNTTDVMTAIEIPIFQGNLKQIATGSFHACALSNQGEVKCWGYNNNGQVGAGTGEIMYTYPVSVVNLEKNIASIYAGNFHTCAITTDNRIKCWGANGDGQLGDGTKTDRNTPVDITDRVKPSAKALGLGRAHTCALIEDGRIKCWGWGDNGQLGHGKFESSLTPVDVIGFEIPVKLQSGKVFMPMVENRFMTRCDDFEPNDGFLKAYGPLERGLTYNARICDSTDDDYYFFDTLSAGENIIRLQITPTSFGNLGIFIYDEYSHFLCGKSPIVESSIALTCTVSKPGKYIIRVVGVNKISDDNNQYSVSVFYP